MELNICLIELLFNSYIESIGSFNCVNLNIDSNESNRYPIRNRHQSLSIKGGTKHSYRYQFDFSCSEITK